MSNFVHLPKESLKGKIFAMKNLSALLLFSFFSLAVAAQPRIISGPMLGPVELRDAKVWVEL